ncbi:hypothetical protein HZA33_04420 [Candidatus Pacearchaeota archaeon]|nr:hypothetical protein [Candidatus Pacearchaeota archaeon]
MAKGLVTIAILAIIFGAINGIFYLLNIFSEIIMGIFAYNTILIFLVYFFLFISAIGVLKFKNWARVTLIVVSAINLIRVLIYSYYSIQGGFPVLKTGADILLLVKPLGMIILIPFYLITLWFFSRSSIKEQFIK